MLEWIAAHWMEAFIVAAVVDGVLGATPQDLVVWKIPVGRYVGVMRRGLRLVLKGARIRRGRGM